MLCCWSLAAFAASPSDTDPLPALAVERPLAWPRGWTSASMTLEHIDDRNLLTGHLRYGVLRGLELFAQGGIAREQQRFAPSGSRFGARIQPWRRDPLNEAVALEVAWYTPYGDPSGQALVLAALAQRQFGPCLVSIGAGPRIAREASALDASIDLLLQLGPIALLVGGDSTLRESGGGLSSELGALVQFSRGLAARGSLARPLFGSTFGSLRDGISIEVAF